MGRFVRLVSQAAAPTRVGVDHVAATPPWSLNWPEVAVTRREPAPVRVPVPHTNSIEVQWPPERVTGSSPPPPQRVIHLVRPPQDTRPMRLPGVTRYLLSNPA